LKNWQHCNSRRQSSSIVLNLRPPRLTVESSILRNDGTDFIEINGGQITAYASPKRSVATGNPSADRRPATMKTLGQQSIKPKQPLQPIDSESSNPSRKNHQQTSNKQSLYLKPNLPFQRSITFAYRNGQNGWQSVTTLLAVAER
jgi:hypothetical protein